jgi:Lamin Tail Domain/Abnormal spindle-like microcephaly-assoc'd, ASPM-SPD-2-Hydin
MKPILPALALLTSAAHGELVITEVMASSAHPTNVAPTPDANGDWWELTNTGSSAVSLNGYSWDDTPNAVTPSISYFPAGITIQAGESIIILEEPAENVATWKAAWGLASSVRVINRTQFSTTGGEGFSGLGVNGDEVNLYDAADNLVAQVQFGVSTTGKSQAFLRDGTPIYGRHSSVGRHGATASGLNPSDVGSPGDAKIHFSSAPVANAKSAYQYIIRAARPGSTAPVLSASGLPSFLTLTPGTAGTATLANNRPLTLGDAGGYLIEITATSGVFSTKQEYLLTVHNPLPAVVLNEYNAVAPANFLNGGDAVTDDDGGALSQDTHFGRVAGNGGQWVEFVVIGTGTLDMRGWSVEIGTNSGTGFTARNILTLSNHVDWEAVPLGTLLTFIDRNTANGGLDSGFALRDNRTTTGDLWSNVWMGDPDRITYTSLAVNGYTRGAGLVSGILIDNNNTQFRVRNAAGQVVFGPAGEGVAPLSGTSSKEVFELENHPTPAVAPYDISTATTRGYDDGASESSFGSPNVWTEDITPITQRFTDLVSPEIDVQQPVGNPLTDGGGIGFGNVAAGGNTSLTFTIRNIGTADLTDLTITRDGANAADFTVTTSPVAPVSGPDGSTTFVVRFAPLSAGAKSAALHLASNDTDEAVFDIQLSGTCFVNAPEIAVQQPVGSELVDGTAKKSFGTVKVGKSSTAKTFTIRNTGKANLTGLALTKAGKHAKDYIITAPAKTLLTPGTSTTFKVTFKPTAKGTRNAVIRLKSNDANENPFDISLTGAAVK